MSVKTQSPERKTTLKQVLLTSEGLKDPRNRWNSFLGLWERANLIRSFLWNQEITDETVLLTQFLARLRRFFSVDFCFAALLFEGAKVLEVGLPEAKREQLPVNFARLCLDLIANSRVPIVWKQRHKPFDFCSTVISPLSPSIGQPLGFVMMGHSMPKSFASSELFLLQSLVGELSWAIRDLRSKKNHRNLLATVSHELKNPLQLIVGQSALLHDDLAQTCSRQQREQFQIIEMNARQLLDLVNGLIDVAVTHAGNLSVLEEPVDLIATLQEIFSIYRKAAEERGLKFEAGLAADLPGTIVADPVKFRQIVRNLINSAMISTEDGGVEVEVKRGKGMLEIVAKERGVGISVKSDRTLCESSSRGSDLLRAQVRGGIGLRVVKEFSDLLKGPVHVHSRPGEGSEFTVCLPCE
jgi:signal transduction histidine kinase